MEKITCNGLSWSNWWFEGEEDLDAWLEPLNHQRRMILLFKDGMQKSIVIAWLSISMEIEIS